MREIERILIKLVKANNLQDKCICPLFEDNYSTYTNIEYRILLLTACLYLNNIINITDIEKNIINYKYYEVDIHNQNISYKDTLDKSNLLMGYWSIINNNENLKKYKKND